MKITKNLLLLTFSASLVPAIYFKIHQWLDREVTDIFELLTGLFYYILVSATFTHIIALIIWALLRWLQKRFPWRKSVAKRLAIELFSTSAITLILTFLFTEGFALIIPEGFYHSIKVYDVLEVAIIINLVLVPVTEGIFFFSSWKDSFVEHEKLLVLRSKLEKQQLQSQFETLKNQINPHFLFNSLNVLSSLIHENTEKAEEFIDEFANVYRYVLDVSGKQTVQLSKEMEFIDSYLFLQRLRFGENLQVTTNYNDHDIEDYIILPLCLQLVVENAIKHNTISKQHPLEINIDINDDFIRVTNNIQLRDEIVVSTGIGLRNITERYRLYNNSTASFSNENNIFTAKIPVIKNELNS